jgi:hypothetical protein
MSKHAGHIHETTASHTTNVGIEFELLEKYACTT